jgi:hypothetical protein
MNDSKRIYAMGAGIAAVILVIALALSVMSNQKVKTMTAPAVTPAPMVRPSARVTTPPAPRPLNTQVRQVVTIPQTSVKQMVTIKKR